MPKKLVSILIVGCLLLVSNASALAQTPTPTSSLLPQTTSNATCDLCGWCNKEIDPSPPPPPGWENCHACLYDDQGNEKTGYYYTVVGCIATKPQSLTKTILSLAVSLSGGIAFLSFLYGSILVLTCRGDIERLKNGKDTVVSSIIGLFLIIFSIFLLKIAGVDIFQIPGFA